jgi:hypothetical protein
MSGTTVCPVNLGPRERRKRLVIGVVWAAVTVAVTALMFLLQAARWWRLTLFVPCWFAALGFLQAQANTCVYLASRGMINLDTGVESIRDEELSRQLRRQARKIHLKALAVGAVVTAALVALP